MVDIGGLQMCANQDGICKAHFECSKKVPNAMNPGEEYRSCTAISDLKEITAQEHLPKLIANQFTSY